MSFIGSTSFFATTHFASPVRSQPGLLLPPSYTRKCASFLRLPFSSVQPARHGRLHASLTYYPNRPECPDGACLFLKRSIESGEAINYRGTIIVLGDVNLGGAVAADGDVIILGKLFGKVHAGRGGNISSTIVALRMEPCGLLIINNIELLLESSEHYGPEIASVVANEIVRKKFQQAGKENSSINTMHKSKYAIQPAKMALITGAYITIVGVAVLLFPISVFGKV